MNNFDGMIFELVPHCASTPPHGWTGDHDLRPLTEAGHQQARALALALAPALRTGVEAIYSSPAVRCLQTVQPLAEALGRPIVELPELLDTRRFAEPREWTECEFQPIAQAVGGAWTAGRALRAMTAMSQEHPGRRVVACTHGDVIPALLAMLCGAYETALPPLPPRGGWYTLSFEGGYRVCSSQLA